MKLRKSEALGQLGQDEPASGMALEPLVGLCPEEKTRLALQRNMGTSLIRNIPLPGPYRRLMPRFLAGSLGGERFLMGEVLL